MQLVDKINIRVSYTRVNALSWVFEVLLITRASHLDLNLNCLQTVLSCLNANFWYLLQNSHRNNYLWPFYELEWLPFNMWTLDLAFAVLNHLSCWKASMESDQSTRQRGNSFQAYCVLYCEQRLLSGTYILTILFVTQLKIMNYVHTQCKRPIPHVW